MIHAAYAVLCVLIKRDIGQEQWKWYLDDHSGCHNFQIDLALSIMNYGIGLQWDGVGAKRLNFMRQDPFVPCICGKGLFFLNRIATGIAHPPSKKAKVTVEYACGTRVMTNNCARDQVNLVSLGTYCRMCYHKQVTTKLTAKEKRFRCRTSRSGCPNCKEPICTECLKAGHDRHT